MSSKKILINAIASKMGGASTYLKNLVKELEKADSVNQYIIYIPSEQAGKIISEKIKIRLVNYGEGSYLRRIWWDQIGIRKIIKKEKIDILFSVANFATFFCPVKQLLLIRGYLYSMPYLKKIILPKFSFKKRIMFCLKQFLIYFSAKAADLVMFPSKSMSEDFEKLYKIPKRKIVINHYGTYLDKFAGYNQKKEIKNKKIYKLLYCAMYTECKNFFTLFLTLNLLKKQNINFQLITPAIFSKKTSTYKGDKELLDNLPIKNNIIFTGKIPYEKIDKLYKEADIFLWPTLTESFGHPLVEAMASGLPIIASDIPINREICKDAALYFDPLDYEDLADKIKLLIENFKLRRDLEEKSFQRSKFFDWRDHVKRLLQVLERTS